jgi:hypothetical protein
MLPCGRVSDPKDSWSDLLSLSSESWQLHRRLTKKPAMHGSAIRQLHVQRMKRIGGAPAQRALAVLVCHERGATKPTCLFFEPCKRELGSACYDAFFLEIRRAGRDTTRCACLPWFAWRASPIRRTSNPKRRPKFSRILWSSSMIGSGRFIWSTSEAAVQEYISPVGQSLDFGRWLRLYHASQRWPCACNST